tara:strand:- start:58 stop:351 length:294 start_codon:yes stop_codon:yes gene_type:complete
MPAAVNFAGPFVPIQGSDLKAEDLSSQINGSKVQFTVSEQFQEERIFVFLNGLFQGPPNGDEITVDNSTQFTISMTPQVGDNLAVIYSPFIKQSSTC